MKKQAELDAEVRTLIEEQLELGEDTPRGWLVQEILGRYSAIQGADVDFYTLCAYSHVTTTVRRVLRPYAIDEEETAEQQIILPGFKRLQKGYIVERDGDSVLVKTAPGHITPNELREKAREYRQMGKGCYEHADELDRLADQWELGGTTA